jgi:uncharacterized membrane protein YczE
VKILHGRMHYSLSIETGLSVVDVDAIINSLCVVFKILLTCYYREIAVV